MRVILARAYTPIQEMSDIIALDVPCVKKFKRGMEKGPPDYISMEVPLRLECVDGKLELKTAFEHFYLTLQTTADGIPIYAMRNSTVRKSEIEPRQKVRHIS